MFSLSRPKDPTPEQLVVLDAPNRIRVVHACPGAGKTEMFVEAIRRKLARWESATAGIAALSFTNVARQTIESRVGGVVTAPHYIGTLDSFAFRFVVKPFGHLVGLPRGRVRLFPATLSNQLESPSVQVGSKVTQRAPLFKVHFSGVVGKKATARAETAFKTEEVPEGQMDAVREAKENFWKKTGIVTHSDCHFLAAWILLKGGEANPVRKLIARRFPTLFIDELQDTGYFLARAFVQLCGEPSIDALVVGDPNQAIYGFGGASPTIFDDFAKLQGASTFRLTRSLRCPKKVAEVVTALSFSKEPVEARADALDGELVLVVHTLATPRLLPPQATFLRNQLRGDKFAVISRKLATAASLRGNLIRDEFQGKSSAARKINLAVQHMGNGDSLAASQIVDRELCRIILDDVQAGESDILDKGITRPQWRAAIFAILTSAIAKVKGETWNDWVTRVKGTVRSQCIALGWKPEDSTALLSYKTCSTDGIKERSTLIDVPVAKLWVEADTISTIHRVKGAEFDTVVVFAPKPSKGNPCPSKEWWSMEEGGEEMRVAFVAASRAKLKLVLCLHEQTVMALKESHPEFITKFGDALVLPNGA